MTESTTSSSVTHPIPFCRWKRTKKQNVVFFSSSPLFTPTVKFDRNNLERFSCWNGSYLWTTATRMHPNWSSDLRECISVRLEQTTFSDGHQWLSACLCHLHHHRHVHLLGFLRRMDDMDRLHHGLGKMRDRWRQRSLHCVRVSRWNSTSSSTIGIVWRSLVPICLWSISMVSFFWSVCRRDLCRRHSSITEFFSSHGISDPCLSPSKCVSHAVCALLVVHFGGDHHSGWFGLVRSDDDQHECGLHDQGNLLTGTITFQRQCLQRLEVSWRVVSFGHTRSCSPADLHSHSLRQSVNHFTLPSSLSYRRPSFSFQTSTRLPLLRLEFLFGLRGFSDHWSTGHLLPQGPS